MRALVIASPFLALALYGVASNAAGGDGLFHWSYTSDDSSREGSGPQATRRFTVGTFDAVALNGSDNVRVRAGPASSVLATGAASDLEKLDIRVEGNILKIGRKPGSWSMGWRNNSRGVIVTVITPALAGAAVNGSGDMTVDRVDTETFRAAVKGSGNLDLTSVKAKKLEFAINGSGNLNASGIADSAQIAVDGSGDFDAKGLTTTRAQIAVRGSGNASMSVSGDATIAVSGSGNVDVDGTDRCTINKAGSGEARCRL